MNTIPPTQHEPRYASIRQLTHQPIVTFRECRDRLQLRGRAHRRLPSGINIRIRHLREGFAV